MSQRATGRTFRKILEGLQAASSGAHVVYITRGHQQSRVVCNKAKEISSGYFETANPTTIRFKGDGWILFLDEYSVRDGDKLMGIDVSTLIWDID